MRRILICTVLAVAFISTAVYAAYPQTITTTSPYVNLPRPKDDPRWAKAFSHWDKRKGTKEVMAALKIFESIARDKPNCLEAHLWLTRTYYMAAMRKKKQRDFYAQKGIASGKKALAMDPGNIFAQFWHNTAFVLITEPTDADYRKICNFNRKFQNIRELPVPKNDPLWAQAMKLWDGRLTKADVDKLEPIVAAGKEIAEKDTKFVQAKSMAVIKILEKLDKKYPNRIEPKLWLVRAYYWMTQIAIDPKVKAAYGKKGMPYGFRSLEMEPRNASANFWTASCISEYGMGTSFAVIVKYSRQLGKQILTLSEEDTNYMHAAFSRYFSGSIAIVGDLVFTVAEWLGFPRPLIARLTMFSVKSEPDFIVNHFMLVNMYEKLGRKEEAKKYARIIVKADPDKLKYQGPENRWIQLITKSRHSDLLE